MRTSGDQLERTHHPAELLSDPPALDRRFCVAPMLDCTDRHARYLMRLISRHAVLYTEMVTTGALLHGDRQRFLSFDASEHPLALQLGGSEPDEMAECAQIAQDWGYDEVNINVGCPSDRVQSGAFGACLMRTPERVAECISAMHARTRLPITVKCRIGVDDQDPRCALWALVEACAQAGCSTFIVHARKAWLKGLSPKENRDVPPLDYDLVYDLKRQFSELTIILNGGISDLEACQRHLTQVDGVMLGREVYANPYWLSQVDAVFYEDEKPCPSRDAVLEAYVEYMAREMAQGTRLNHMTRHAVGSFHGEPRSRIWRRCISEQAHKPDSDHTLLLKARAAMA